MGYYMRYVVADDRAITADVVQAAFGRLGPDYRAEADGDEVTVEHRGDLIAHVTLNVPGDGLFDEERDELLEFAADADDAPGKARVLATLRAARGIVAVQVLGTRETDALLSALDAFWAWLFRERQGLLQADGEGYYSPDGLVLAVA